MGLLENVDIQRRECNLTPNLMSLYSALTSAIREQFCGVPPEFIADDDLSITVMDVDEAAARPFLWISQGVAGPLEGGDEEDEPADEEAVVILHVGLLRCEGCRCGILVDSKQYYLHPFDEVLMRCGLWNDGLMVMGYRKGRHEAVKYWLLDAGTYVDHLLQLAAQDEGDDRRAVLERYRAAIASLEEQFVDH